MESYSSCSCLISKDTGFEQFSKCSIANFKDDISKLCDECPMKKAIEQGIIHQIEYLANTNKEIRTEDSFEYYLRNEIESGSKVLERIRLNVLQDEGRNIPYIVMLSRVQTYIWNKERLLSLRRAESKNHLSNEDQFSALEWATIFYYADETKLLLDASTLVFRKRAFMKEHGIKTTFQNFKSKYYQAKKRINVNNDYPTDKLKYLVPFMLKHYPQTVTKIENDIVYLEEEQSDY